MEGVYFLSDAEKLPWFKFWAEKWIVGTRMLSLKQQGAWARMLAEAHLNKGKRGVVEGSVADFGLIWAVDEAEAEMLLGQLQKRGVGHVEKLTDGRWRVTSDSAQREEKERKQGRLRKRKQRSRDSPGEVTGERLEARSQSNLNDPAGDALRDTREKMNGPD